jgi:hypothetical protein
MNLQELTQLLLELERHAAKHVHVLAPTGEIFAVSQVHYDFDDDDIVIYADRHRLPGARRP